MNKYRVVIDGRDGEKVYYVEGTIEQLKAFLIKKGVLFADDVKKVKSVSGLNSKFEEGVVTDMSKVVYKAL